MTVTYPAYKYGLGDESDWQLANQATFFSDSEPSQ